MNVRSYAAFANASYALLLQMRRDQRWEFRVMGPEPFFVIFECCPPDRAKELATVVAEQHLRNVGECFEEPLPWQEMLIDAAFDQEVCCASEPGPPAVARMR